MTNGLTAAYALRPKLATGGAEVASYIGRHGTDRVANAAWISAVPPFMLKIGDNPDGVPIEELDSIGNGLLALSDNANSNA